MQIYNIFLADPYNDEHIKMLNTYETNHNIDNRFSKNLLNIREKYSKLEYEKIQDNSYNISQILFTKTNNEIRNCCYLRAEKDRKLCEITISNGVRLKDFITEVTNYSFDALGMETVIVSIDKKEKNLETTLQMCGFENLEEVEGKIMFLKERELDKDISQKIA